MYILVYQGLIVWAWRCIVACSWHHMILKLCLNFSSDVWTVNAQLKWKINYSKHLSDLQNEATAREGQFCFSCLWIHFWMARMVYKRGQIKNPEHHLMGSPNFSWNGQSTKKSQHIAFSLPSLLKPSPISMGLGFWSEVFCKGSLK